MFRRYGLTEDEFNRRIRSQNGLCACCGKPPKPHRRATFVVDHDHKTNQVRGLICQKCNVGLGYLGDTVESLRAALRYLEAAERYRTLSLVG